MDTATERAHRQRCCALGYRVFGLLRFGQLGDGHISARDPEHTDHFWMLAAGVPFSAATVDDLVLVGPDGLIAERARRQPDRASGDRSADDRAINMAAYYIHWPILEARPEVVAAAHTHTPWGTAFSAQVRPFAPISQEACNFVFDQAMFDDEELDILSTKGGERIATAMGNNKLVVLRNHGLLTAAPTVEAAVGAFVMAERVAEVHLKAGDGAKPISVDGAKPVAAHYADNNADAASFHYLVRDLVPDPGVVDPDSAVTSV